MSAWVLIVFMSVNAQYNSAHGGAVAIDMPDEAACRAAYHEMLGQKDRPSMWGYCMKRL
jgi:hypothetical protein